MQSKTKLIEEGKALFAETHGPLRGHYERLFGEFRRLLAEAENDKGVLKEQLTAAERNVAEIQGALQAERRASQAQDARREALQKEIDGLRRDLINQEREIPQRDLRMIGGKRLNPFNPEILNIVRHADLQKMIDGAVRDYNQGLRSTEIMGLEDRLIVTTGFARRFAVLVGKTEVDMFFLDEDPKLERALRNPCLHTRTSWLDPA